MFQNSLPANLATPKLGSSPGGAPPTGAGPNLAFPWHHWYFGAWRMFANPPPHQLAPGTQPPPGMQMPVGMPVGMPGMPMPGGPGGLNLEAFKPLSGSNDDLNGSDMESDLGSENEEVSEIDSEKLDASHREIIEKLKRQEQEEREEIEREIIEARREAFVRAHHPDDFRSQDLRIGDGKDREGRDDMDIDDDTPQMEIKTQRPLGLLAQHGLSTKTHHHHSEREKEKEKEKDVNALNKKDDDVKEDVQSSLLDRRDGPMGELDLSSGRDRGERTEMDRTGGERDWRDSLKELKDRSMGIGGPGGMDFPHHQAFMDRSFGGPPVGGGPPGGPHTPHTPHSSPSAPNTPTPTGESGASSGTSSGGHHWTFEEQFKQLYELSDDVKRREFLDELFAFMQKRGTPVNRIPIMAKQTLDLYELFKLVVSKGGLVEVINKKLWREITKGLNLPSSITSAAFTLRTQYMKYLYPYECEKMKLSSPSELQAAIDGNRREGRRPSYGYDFSPIPTMIPTPPGPHLNGGFHPHHMNGRPGGNSPKDKLEEEIARWPFCRDGPHNLLKAGNHSDEDRSLPSTPNHLHTLAERDARAMEAAARAMEEAQKRIDATRAAMTTSIGSSSTNTSPVLAKPDPDHPIPAKRLALGEDRLLAHIGMPSAHLKITSRSDGRSEFDNSLVVSMEINGIMYQGVLFAQHPRRM